MAKTDKVGAHKTSIYHTDYGDTVVQYHNTQVVRFNDDEIILDSGGWQTVTTKLRMNQASNMFHLGFRVSQRQHEWFVDYFAQGRLTFTFRDGMILERHKEEEYV